MTELFRAATEALKAMTAAVQSRPTFATGGKAAVIGYGRYCPYLARSFASAVLHANPVVVAVSGNVGKDSGPLVRFGIPEAHYVLSAADTLTQGSLLGYSLPVLVDLDATNGLENAANLVALLTQYEHTADVVVVAHSTQMLRLGLTFKQAAINAGATFGTQYWWPSGYIPDPGRLLDQWEIFFEITRLLELAGEGHLELPDLPASVIQNAQPCLQQAQRQLRDLGFELISTAGLVSVA